MDLGPVGQIVTLLPVPHSLVTMDKILEAVVTSSYPASVKQGLVRRVLEAAQRGGEAMERLMGDLLPPLWGSRHNTK